MSSARQEASLTKEVVEARRITKSYETARGHLTALDAVSLSIWEAQFVTLVGPSGCGKSTLLHIVAGLVPATAGEVLIEGERLAGPRPDKIGMVFQEPLLLPWKTAAENVEFPLALQGMMAADRRRRAFTLLELVGLREFVHSYPHELSGGMKQRVAIARGLVRDPRILLMDEPFAALDEQTRMRMWSELLQIWSRSRTTILFVTHGLVEAVYLADKVLVMGAGPGRIVEQIDVDLPRPRTLEMLGSKTLGELRNRVWRLISEPAE
jgi:NitT/TauT family transport system ATP-binding protein